jgi:hypothetical protein
VTAHTEAAPDASSSSRLPTGVPALDDVAGHWIDAADLAHLPSLRNQYGQGHVNRDLTSLSWLAAPPYSFGYHTGVLRLDGHVPAAQRYEWKPWGVRREHVADCVTVRTDTRMAFTRDQLLWSIEVTNTGTESTEHVVELDLYAMVAHTETGWGWLYDVPWTAGNYHDFMTLERIRATTATEPDAPYIWGSGQRRLRLGKPRLPGIQRDHDTDVMDLATELPRHVSPDTVYPYDRGACATVRSIRCHAGDRTILAVDDEHHLEPDGEVVLDAFELAPGHTLTLQVRPDADNDTGVILTHGNHPDSLQIGLEDGRLWFGVAGEKEYATHTVTPGTWHTVEISAGTRTVTMALDGRHTARTGHWTRSPRWKAVSDGTAVTIADTLSPARAVYAFATDPTALTDIGAGYRATWHLQLAAGERRTIGVVCAYGDDDSEVARAAVGSAATIDEDFARTADGYRQLWADMFTPGNAEFSGHLPTLHADNPDIGTAYYMGALLALYMRNTRISVTEPIFLTGGPRLGPTANYFWDHTEWSRLYALLEPAGLRSWLLRALATPYNDCFGFDTRSGGPLGNDYVSNHYALFRLVEHYVAITGDLAFLQASAGSQTVLGHLADLAHGWQDKRTPATGGILADFGPDPWLLLECVPDYVNVVASFNAAYAGMMRDYAALRRMLGDDEVARTAETQANQLAAAVLDLAAPGGRWQIRHPEHRDVIGHCLDFGLVASYLHDDLDDEQRHAMVEFVTTKLLDSTWMRALAPDDPAAPYANRPDHGAAGAFGAWPGVTAHGLAKLGRPDLAADLLAVVHAAASGGLWGQAQEIVDDEHGKRVRVAEDGVSNRDAIAGVGIAEAVVSGLFSFEPSFRSVGSPPVGRIEVPGVGILTHINITASPGHID